MRANNPSTYTLYIYTIALYLGTLIGNAHNANKMNRKIPMHFSNNPDERGKVNKVLANLR